LVPNQQAGGDFSQREGDEKQHRAESSGGLYRWLWASGVLGLGPGFPLAPGEDEGEGLPVRREVARI